MNAVEIEAAISDLALEPFDAAEFPFAWIYGASEYIRGDVRYCLWLGDDDAEKVKSNPAIATRLECVAKLRLNSLKPAPQKGASWPHRFEEVKQTGAEVVTIVPKVSSEPREYLPVGLLPPGFVITDLAFALYDAPSGTWRS